MRFPLVSRRRHERELAKLRESISSTCNTGCRTAKCTRAVSEASITPKRNGSRNHHTHTYTKKMVMVTLHSGEKFTAKLKDMEGQFHSFYGHPRVKSSLVKRVSLLPADYKESKKEEGQQ